jgi:hypothetical protein
MNFTNVNWPLLGLAVGTFWGIFAALFYAPPDLPWKKTWDVIRSIVVLLFQFFFNFIGGFAGCIGLGLFFERYSHCHFGWPELVLLAVSLIAVSGKLSDIIYKLPGLVEPRVIDFRKIIEKVLKSLAGNKGAQP